MSSVRPLGWALVLAALGGLAPAGCGARGTPATADPAIASAAIERTAPDRPLRVIFDWTMLDGDARFSGSGAARIQPPDRARLDLFGPRGEGYLSAAVVGEDVRLPPGTGTVPLPPPALMWAALGVVAPPADAALEGTRVRDGRAELHYVIGDGRLVYQLVDGRLTGARWTGAGRRMAVELTGDVEMGLPRQSLFRDWSGNTELRLRLEEIHEVDPYPPEIWRPDA